MTIGRTLTRIAFYTGAALIAWTLVIQPHTQLQPDGYYPHPPSPVTLTDHRDTTTYLIPGVTSEPVSPAAETWANFTASYYNPLTTQAHGIPEHQQQKLAQQHQDARDVAASITGQQPPGTALQPSNHYGTSFGLATTLAHIDATNTGTLHPTTVAATGTVTPDGKVHRIAGVHAKLVGLQQDGQATLFFIPEDNANQLPADTGDITVIPVNTVQEAITWLCNHYATDTVCQTLAP